MGVVSSVGLEPHLVVRVGDIGWNHRVQLEISRFSTGGSGWLHGYTIVARVCDCLCSLVRGAENFTKHYWSARRARLALLFRLLGVLLVGRCVLILTRQRASLSVSLSHQSVDPD